MMVMPAVLLDWAILVDGIVQPKVISEILDLLVEAYVLCAYDAQVASWTGPNQAHVHHRLIHVI